MSRADICDESVPRLFPRSPLGRWGGAALGWWSTPDLGEQCAARRARCEPACARRRAQTEASGGAVTADQAPRWRAIGASPKSAPAPLRTFFPSASGMPGEGGSARGEGGGGATAPKPRRMRAFRRRLPLRSAGERQRHWRGARRAERAPTAGLSLRPQARPFLGA